MGEPTPPGSMPAIKDGMLLRFDLKTFCSLIGITILATAFYFKVDAFDKRLARIERWMGVSDDPVVPKALLDPRPHGGNP